MSVARSFWIAVGLCLAPRAFAAEVHCGMHLMYGNPGGVDQMLCRTGYAAGYSYAHKDPLWVAFSVTSASAFSDHHAKRQNDFREDPEVPEADRSTPADYDEPVYDQGHMADSAVIDFTAKANSETFLMSNMTPQIPEMNRAAFGKHGAWGTLENKIRAWLKMRGHLYIIAGALYEAPHETIGNGVSVPTALYKIVMDVKSNNAIAFLFPAKDKNTGTDLTPYLVSIDQIEQRTGLDFFADLPDEVEEPVERHIEQVVWQTR